jgi:hypothetical protein
MTGTAPALEVVEHTLAEYERIAIGTGQWNGAEAPEFSNDGVIWWQAWLPTEAFPYPLLARATAYRHGVDRPTVVVVRWDESVPAIDGWRELWLRKPTALFGAFARRAAIRSAFRDVLGDRREPDEVDPPKPAEPAVERDWFAAVDEAQTIDEVMQVHQAARRARAVTVELERAIRMRHRAIIASAAEKIDAAEPVVEQKTDVAPATGTAGATPQNFPKPSPPKVRLEETVRRPQPRKRGK